MTRGQQVGAVRADLPARSLLTVLAGAGEAADGGSSRTAIGWTWIRRTRSPSAWTGSPSTLFDLLARFVAPREDGRR